MNTIITSRSEQIQIACNLQDKTVVVTGATSGIGLAVAEKTASEVRQTQGEQLARELWSLAGELTGGVW